MTIQLKINQRAFAAPNPVALHGAHFFRPAAQLVEIAKQFIRVLGDFQKPLFQFALLDRRIFVAPAATINHLLIRQHGRALRTPIDFALLTIGKALLVELQKKPLVPLVIFREASCNLA